jgi:hypothetical protein
MIKRTLSILLELAAEQNKLSQDETKCIWLKILKKINRWMSKTGTDE